MKAYNKSSAIISALILVVIGGFIIGGYLLYVSQEVNMTMKLTDSIKALYIAEAGLERTISDLTLDDNWFDGDLNGYSAVGINTVTYVAIDYNAEGSGNAVIFGEGQYSVDVLKISDFVLRLRSTGAVENESRVISEDVSRQTVFDWAVFGSDGVTLRSNALIDSYNSEEGAYDPNNAGDNGDVGTNALGSGAISLGSNAVIKGDVFIGPSGDPEEDITRGSNSEITGETDTLDNEINMPEITAPTDLPYKGAIFLEGTDTLIISTDGQYDSIVLNDSSFIIINQDVVIYVTGALTLKSGSRIDMIDNANVTIYVDGSFSMESNTSINNPSNDPTAFQLYGTDSLTTDNVSFNSNVGLYGSVYMRMVDFVMASNSQIFGSLAAKSVTMNSNAKVHYDEALADTGPSTGLMKVRDWCEVY